VVLHGSHHWGSTSIRSVRFVLHLRNPIGWVSTHRHQSNTPRRFRIFFWPIQHLWKNHFTAVNWWISMGPCPSATCHSICSWGSGRRCKALPTFPDRVGCSRIRSLAFRACWMTAQSLGKLGNLRHLRPKLAAKGGNHDFSAWNGQVWMAIHQFQRTEKDDTYKRKDCSFTLIPLTWKICSSLPPGISTKCQWFILAFVNDKSHPNINTPGFRMWFHPLNSSTPRFLGGV
jgi:hypothetical protein